MRLWAWAALHQRRDPALPRGKTQLLGLAYRVVRVGDRCEAGGDIVGLIVLWINGFRRQKPTERDRHAFIVELIVIALGSILLALWLRRLIFRRGCLRRHRINFRFDLLRNADLFIKAL